MKNTNFKKTLDRTTCGTAFYTIQNYKGMTDAEIINACDPNNFGGQVYGNTCIVYID